MDLVFGRWKVRMEIVALIVFVAWLLFGHLLVGCCNVPVSEMFTLAKLKVAPSAPTKPGNAPPASVPFHAPSVDPFQSWPKSVETFLSVAPMSRPKKEAEGFTTFADAKAPGYIKNPSTWSVPTLTYSPGTTPDAGVKSLWNRPKQPIPLPEGQLDMLATTEFKPECCPNAYSTSTGCACMTMDQYNALHTRFGNNVPYSEY